MGYSRSSAEKGKMLHTRKAQAVKDRRYVSSRHPRNEKPLTPSLAAPSPRRPVNDNEVLSPV